MNSLSVLLANYFSITSFAKYCRLCSLLIILSFASGCCTNEGESQCGEQCCGGDNSCVDEGDGPVCKEIENCSLCNSPKVCCSAAGNKKKCCNKDSYCIKDAPYCKNKKNCLAPQVLCGGNEDKKCCDNCCTLEGFPPACIGKQQFCCDCNGTKKVCDSNTVSSCEACCGNS